MVTVRERVRILLRNFNSARAPARATIVPVRRRRESEGRDRQVFPPFTYNRCEPSHVGGCTCGRECRYTRLHVWPRILAKIRAGTE